MLSLSNWRAADLPQTLCFLNEFRLMGLRFLQVIAILYSIFPYSRYAFSLPHPLESQPKFCVRWRSLALFYGH